MRVFKGLQCINWHSQKVRMTVIILIIKHLMTYDRIKRV